MSAVCRQADIIVAALAFPDGEGGLDQAKSHRAVAGAITPVPGGVGPMTIACLLPNTYGEVRTG